MIPPEYQAVAVRLARLGRNDAYVLCEAAIAAKVPALDLLCQHLDATLARYKALPALSPSNGPNCASAPKMPAKVATHAQAPAKPDPAPSVATPADLGHVAGLACPEPVERGKHGADDAAKRAALRAAMAEAPPALEHDTPIAQDSAAVPKPEHDTAIAQDSAAAPEPEQAAIHQLPVVAHGGELFLDAQAALVGLGWAKSEARRMAKAAIEAGAADVEAVIRACTRKAK